MLSRNSLANMIKKSKKQQLVKLKKEFLLAGKSTDFQVINSTKKNNNNNKASFFSLLSSGKLNIIKIDEIMAGMLTNKRIRKNAEKITKKIITKLFAFLFFVLLSSIALKINESKSSKVFVSFILL